MILEFRGEKDHVHILFVTPPQIQLSKLVNTLKTVSSKLIKKQYEQHLKKYYWKSQFIDELKAFAAPRLEGKLNILNDDFELIFE